MTTGREWADRHGLKGGHGPRGGFVSTVGRVGKDERRGYEEAPMRAWSQHYGHWCRFCHRRFHRRFVLRVFVDVDQEGSRRAPSPDPSALQPYTDMTDARRALKSLPMGNGACCGACSRGAAWAGASSVGAYVGGAVSLGAAFSLGGASSGGGPSVISVTMAPSLLAVATCRAVLPSPSAMEVSAPARSSVVTMPSRLPYAA